MNLDNTTITDGLWGWRFPLCVASQGLLWGSCVKFWGRIGKEALEDGYGWEYPPNALHRFFKVTVEMPK